MSYKIGIDVGGTHTDFVMQDENGAILRTLKVPSTPASPVEGVVAGLTLLEDSEKISTYVNGTTIGTNALLQRRLPDVGLVTTKGFRDVLLIRRETKEDIYDLFWKKPEPLVQRRNIFEVEERMDYLGEILKPLDTSNIPEICQRFRDAEIKYIAICLLHSYANDKHEQDVAKAISQEYPEAELTISSQIYPEWREFERTYNTVLNAALKPVVSGYLTSLEDKVAEGSDDTSVFVMQANGGITSASEIVKRPVHTLHSGVAGGAIGGAFLAQKSGHPKVITLDMGGTSTDMCIVEDGVPTVTSELFLEWEGTLGFSAVDVQSIGAGGGSIAWLDEVGALRVGPQSSGADPGPACYAKGGTDPTVTDANVVLGYISPKTFLGGKGNLDTSLSHDAVTRIAQKAGIETHDMAIGISKIVNANMLNGLRQVSVEKGYDPRDFALVCCGGAGPLHAASLMQTLGIPKTLIPIDPGNVSSFGMIAARPRAEESRTFYVGLLEVKVAELDEIFRELTTSATTQLTSSGVPQEEISIIRSLDMRYQGQTFEISVPVTSVASWDPDLSEDIIKSITKLFDAEHERRYTYSSPGEPIMIVHVRVIARGPESEVSLEQSTGHTNNTRTEDQEKTKRSAYFEIDGNVTMVETSVWDRGTLSQGSQIIGPAIVEEDGSTTVVPPGFKIEVDQVGNMLMEES